MGQHFNRNNYQLDGHGYGDFGCLWCACGSQLPHLTLPPLILFFFLDIHVAHICKCNITAIFDVTMIHATIKQMQANA